MAPPRPSTPEPAIVLRTAEVDGWDQLDPHKTASPTFYHFFGNVYSGLLRWETGPDTPSEVRRLVPDLAERWEQADARTYRLALSPDARWHDLPPVNGRRVTAADVVYNVDRLRGSSAHRALWARVASAQALGEDVVEIILTEPYPPFLALLASGFSVLVAPEAVQEGGGDLYEGPAVGTGPFLFDAAASHRASVGVFLRNPSFYEPGRPRLDRLERVVAGSEEARMALLRAGRIDFALLAPLEAQRLLDEGGLSLGLAGQPGLGGWALSFKQRPPFDRSAARRAASLALDRAALWAAYSGTQLPPALGLGMPLPDAGAALDREEVLRAYIQDAAAAQGLLRAAGVAPGIPLAVTVGDYGPRARAAGQALVQQLQAVGLGAKLRVVSPALYAATVQAAPGLFEMAFGPVSAPEEADLWLSARFLPGGALNAAGIADPELARMIEAQRRQTDPIVRAALLREIQRLLLEEAFQSTVFLDQTWAAWRLGLEGWPTFLDEPFQRFLRQVDTRPGGP